MTDQYRDLPGLVRRLVDDYLSAAKELERLRSENEDLSEGLTTAYMCGFGKGKEVAKEELAELKAERDKIETALKKMISMYIIDDYIHGEDRENKIKDIFRRMMEEA